MGYFWGDLRRFNSYKRFLHAQFGGRVQKLTIDAGFTCPNRDGTLGIGGCTYCLNDAFNPSYCHPSKTVSQQLEEGIEFHRNRYRRAENYLAYFQAYSNTYAPLEKLKEIYQPAIEHPLVKGIVVGTRPDCVNAEILDFFADLHEKMFVSIEFGIESCRNATLQRVHRGHTFEQAVKAIEETASRNIHTGGHFIFGLPGETPQQWLDDVHLINELPLHSIKFHQLQVIKNTPLEREFIEKSNDFHLFSLEEYVAFIGEYIQWLNPQFIIERFAGEVPPRYLVENIWGTIRYDSILQKIEKHLEEKNIYQGKKYGKF